MNIFLKAWNLVCEKFSKKVEPKKELKELSIYEKIAGDLKHEFAFKPKDENTTLIYAPETSLSVEKMERDVLNIESRKITYPKMIKYNDGSCTTIKIVNKTHILSQQELQQKHSSY